MAPVIEWRGRAGRRRRQSAALGGRRASVLPLPAPLSIDASGPWPAAASGDPITLSVLDIGGVVAGPGRRLRRDIGFRHAREEKGVAVGGNRITGLGANGQEADAGEINSIALGNRRDHIGGAAEPSPWARLVGRRGATGTLALGQGASRRARQQRRARCQFDDNRLVWRSGLQPRHRSRSPEKPRPAKSRSATARNFAASPTSPPAAADTDAANIGQLKAVDDKITDLGDWVLRYDTVAKDVATLEGASGTTDQQPRRWHGLVDLQRSRQRIAILRRLAEHRQSSRRQRDGRVDGTVTGPTYLIEGANYTTIYKAFEAVDTGLANVNMRIDNIDTTVGEVSDRAVRYDGAEGAPKDIITLEGASGSLITNLRPGLLERLSTDAVNGSQLHDTNVALAALRDHAVHYDLDIDGNKTNVVTLLGGDPSTPVVVKNVDAGVDPTDAVNVAQLEEGMNTTLITANTYADTLAFNFGGDVVKRLSTSPTQYTDFRVGQLETADRRREQRGAPGGRHRACGLLDPLRQHARQAQHRHGRRLLARRGRGRIRCRLHERDRQGARQRRNHRCRRQLGRRRRGQLHPELRGR